MTVKLSHHYVDMVLVDKSQIQLHNRSCLKYFNVVQGFLDFAFENIKEEDMKIKCSCMDCNNTCRRTRDEVEQHLLYRQPRAIF